MPLPMPTGAFHQFGLSFVHQDLGLARPLTRAREPRRRLGRQASIRGGGCTGGPRPPRRARCSTRTASTSIRGRSSTSCRRSARRWSPSPAPPKSCASTAIRTGATSSVLVLDEPTVFLPQEELSVPVRSDPRRWSSSGSSVIFISHDLPAVRTIADRVTVLRDGRVVATASMADVSDEQIVEYIVGPVKSRELSDSSAAAPRSARVLDRSETGLRVTGLQGGRLRVVRSRRRPRRDRRHRRAAGLGCRRRPVPVVRRGQGRRWDGHDPRAHRRTSPSSIRPKRFEWACRSSRPIASRDGIAGEIEVDRNMMLLVVDRFLRSARLRNRDLRATADRAGRRVRHSAPAHRRSTSAR